MLLNARICLVCAYVATRVNLISFDLWTCPKTKIPLVILSTQQLLVTMQCNIARDDLPRGEAGTGFTMVYKSLQQQMVNLSLASGKFSFYPGSWAPGSNNVASHLDVPERLKLLVAAKLLVFFKQKIRAGWSKLFLKSILV